MYNGEERFSRTDLLFGENTALKLAEKKVLVVGVGGVGGHAAENIIRAGVGNAVLLDGDTVDISNCNRQIIALDHTIGSPKAEVLADRCRQINPSGTFTTITKFLKTPEDIAGILDREFDFIVDAIDDVPVKVELIRQLKEKNLPFISSMGAGGKTDPSQVAIADLGKTHGCPLARILRGKLLKELRLKGIPCVYSPEPPLRSFTNRKIGSISYMPAVFGCFCASAALRHLVNTAD